MDSFVENLNNVRQRLQDLCGTYCKSISDIQIVAATKSISVERINLLSENGIAFAGENRVQEFLKKFDRVQNIEWHFIGALQTNKVKKIIDKVSLIHSLDRTSLADEIDQRAKEFHKKMNVLIEVNVGNEPTKSGICEGELQDLIDYVQRKDSLNLKGFMSVLPIGADEKLYEKMQIIFEGYKKQIKTIDTLSMGMSDDYITAIKHGANLIRLGTALFGQRQ